jgi:phosphoribosylformimino-5-aminoimidazole carboxamide ribotide isomerase
MKLFPAIDLRDGRCVRLYQGDYDRETRYGDDPAAQARAFAEAGAEWLHVVDLDAARTGDPKNRDVIASICSAVDVPVQCGGGVRDEAAAAALAAAGVARVVIGTAAIKRPELVERVAADQSVAVGLDARGRQLAAHGWEESTDVDLLDAARRFAAVGVDAFVVTEIAVDGTLAGPAIEQLRDVVGATPVEVVASGGVGTLADLDALAQLEVDGRRLGGAIIGRALYEGAFTLADALAQRNGDAP